MNSVMAKEGLRDATVGVLSGKALALLSADVDGVLTAQQTIAAETTYAVAALDGALVTPAGSGRFAVPRNVTVSTTSHAGAYHITDPIVVTGVRAWDGVTTTESLYLTSANGPETITGVTMWASIISVLVPAQHDTSGTISVGCGTSAMATGTCTGVVTPGDYTNANKGNNHRDSGGGARGVYVGTAGNLVVTHWNDSTTTSYVSPATGTYHPMWIKSIHEGTTATDIVRGQ